MLRALNEIRALKDPLKQSQIEFVITEIPGLLLAKTTQKVAGLLSGNTALADSKTLRLRCTSYEYPGSKVNQSSLNIMGFKRTCGTNQDKSGTWNVSITEDYNGSVLNIIQAWMDLIHSNVLGTRIPRTYYACTAQIKIGGEGINAKTTPRTIYLQGVYPLGYSVGKINPTSSDPVSINVRFNYDWFGDNSYSLTSLF